LPVDVMACIPPVRTARLISIRAIKSCIYV